MANSKISALAALTGANVAKGSDYLPIIDASEADVDKNKRILVNELRASMFCGAMAKKAADQTGANYTTETTVVWDSESYDTDAWHDTVTNNTRLTVPSGLGITKVLITCSLRVQNAGSANATALTLYKNGSATFDGACTASPWQAGSPTFYNLSMASGPIPVTDADYFEVKLQHATDTSIDIITARSHFSIQAVG